MSAADIARTLTPAQRRVITGPARGIGNPETIVLIDQWLAYDGRGAATRKRLTALKLIEEGRFGPTMLTALGVEVRSLLMAAP